MTEKSFLPMPDVFTIHVEHLGRKVVASSEEVVMADDVREMRDKYEARIRELTELRPMSDALGVHPDDLCSDEER